MPQSDIGNLEDSLLRLQEKHIIHNLKMSNDNVFEACRFGLSNVPIERLFFLSCERLISQNEGTLSLSVFEDVQNRLLGERFFQENTTIRWNYYLYIIFEKQGTLNNIEKEAIESDFHYARKRFVMLNELEEQLASLTPSSSADNLPDPEAEWLRILEPVGLSGCLYLRQYTKYINSYVEDGNSICPDKNKGKGYPLETVPVPQRINRLLLKNYRKSAFAGQPPIEFSLFNLLEGANGTGKSSVIDAIEFAMTGSIKRLAESNGNLEGEVIADTETEQGGSLKLSSNCVSPDSKSRSHSWYNSPTKGEPSISQKFEHFNRFSIESVFSLIASQCVEPDDALQTSMSRLCFGEDVSQMEKNWNSFKTYFQDKRKQLDKAVTDKNTRINLLTKQISQNIENIHHRQQDINELYTALFGHEPVLINDLEKLEDIYQRSQQEMASLISLKESFSLRQLTQQLDKLQVQSVELKKQAEQYQNLLNKRDNIMKAMTAMGKQRQTVDSQIAGYSSKRDEILALQKELQQLNVSEYNLEPQYISAYNTCGAIEKILEKYQSFWNTFLDQPLIPKMQLEATIQDTTENYTQISTQVVQIGQQLKSLKQQEQDVRKTNNQLQQLQADILQKGRELLHNTRSSNCPFCGEPYQSTDELLKRANKLTDHCAGLEQKRLAELLEEIAKVENSHAERKKLLPELEEYLVYAEELSRIYSDCTAYIEVENLETGRQLYDLLKNQLKMLTIRIKELLNPLEALKNFRLFFSRMGVAQNTLDKYATCCNTEIASLQNRIKEFDQAHHNYDVQLSNISTAIETQPFNKEDLSAIQTELTQYHDWLTAVEHLQLMGIKTDADESLLLLRDRLRRLEGVHQLAQQNIRVATANKELLDLQKDVKTIEEQLIRCKTAVNALGELTATLDYSTGFIRNNLLQINLLFRRLHLPPEFSTLEIWDKEIVTRRYGSDEITHINQMSMGQKTSLALAILFQMHMMKDTIPRILLFDEPIANLDDVHIMNMVDILCDLVLNGTQVFITTANHDVARYIERKFAFLEGDFTYYQLNRDISKTQVGKTKFNKKQVSSQIASGE